MSNTFLPGPTPNTVRVADGKALSGPNGWVLLPRCDAALTRQINAACDQWVVAEQKGWKPDDPTRSGIGGASRSGKRVREEGAGGQWRLLG